MSEENIQNLSLGDDDIPVLTDAPTEQPVVTPSVVTRPVIMPTSTAMASVNKPLSADSAADGALLEVGLNLDEDLLRRFRLIADLFFRDLRDELETVSKMTMSVASSGLGLDEATAKRLCSVLKSRRDSHASGLSERLSDEKQKFVSEQANRHFASMDDQAELDELHERVTTQGGVVKEAVTRQPIRINVENHDEVETKADAKPKNDDLMRLLVDDLTKTADVARSEKPKDVFIHTKKVEPPANLPVVDDEVEDTLLLSAPAGPEKIEAAPISAIIAGKSTPVLVPKEPEKKAAETPVSSDASKVTAVESPKVLEKNVVANATSEQVQSLPPQPVAVLKREKPQEPQVTETASDKPAFTDVVGKSRLVGPVDELRRMRLIDFRRLSKDPKEACLKISDKIDLLADQSFGLRQQGIDAWHDSEPNRLYLEILRSTLDGISLSEAIKKSAPESLSEDEFRNLMELNSKLRFG